MTESPALESLFLRFRERGDAQAFTVVFDRTAPELARVAAWLAAGDHACAEDLLQQTWLTAIARAAAWDGARPLLPWLLGVLANHARNMRRKRRRQETNHEAMATLLATDDPLRASVEGEFAQLLQKALADLPPPFREAVALHVQHGLTAAEIGVALGRPAGTVRTQIVRGLDRLRALLPASLATAGVGTATLSAQQIAQVRSRVLADARLPTAYAPAQLVRWVGALAAAAAATLSVLTLRAADVAPAAAPPAVAPLQVVAAPVLQPVREPAPAIAEIPFAPAAQGPARQRIAVRVRHADEPTVEAGELVGLVVGDDVRFQATDARGDVVFEDVPSAQDHVAFVTGVAAQAASPLRNRRAERQELTVQVPASSVLTVYVVDANGNPVAGAEVESNGSQHSRRRWCPLGVTGGDGALRRRGQASHGAQLRARAVGHAPSRLGPSTVHADGTQSCTLRLLPAGPQLRGRVVDAGGKPIAAELGTIAFASDLVEPWYDLTASDGTFALDWLPPGAVALVARATDATGSAVGMLRLDAQWAGPVELRVGSGARFVGTTSFADGAPCGGSQVSLRLLADGAFAFPFAQRDVRSIGAGAFAFDGLLPGRWLARAWIGDEEIDAEFDLFAGETATWDAVAPPLHALRVRAIDEQGRPLSGWRVQVQDANGFGGAAALTDDDGTTIHPSKWMVSNRRPMTIALFDPEAFAVGASFPCWRVPGATADGGTVEVAVPDWARTSHRITGVIVDERGSPLRATVRALGVHAWLGGPSVACAADGRFVIGPFAPGRVRIEVAAPDHAPLLLQGVEVPRVGDADLGALQMGLPAAVRIAAAAGTAVPADLALELTAVRGGETTPMVQERGGEFARDRLAPGEHRLTGSSATHRVVPQVVAVVPGATTRAAFQLAAAPAVSVVVELSAQSRAQSAYRAQLLVRDGAGAVVLRRRLARDFHGIVPAELRFAVALPTGDYLVELDRGLDQTGSVRLTVGDDGAEVRFRH